MADKETFFVQSIPSILMSNKYLRFFHSNITYGVVNSTKICAKSSSSLGLLLLAAKETFFVQSIPSILMSNKNLRFFSFKHQIEVVNSTKIYAKSSGP